MSALVIARIHEARTRFPEEPSLIAAVIGASAKGREQRSYPAPIRSSAAQFDPCGLLRRSIMSTIAPNRRRVRLLLVVTPLVALTACSTGGQRLTRTGFLTDYSQMHSTNEHKKSSIYVAPDYAPANYTKVIIEPVAWLVRKRDDKASAKLSADFHERLVRSFSTKYQVVEAAEVGPGVLRVRSAITGARAARWYYNVPAQAAQLALGGLGLFRPSSGGASQEMQVQDALTGRPFVQVATFRNGKPWHISGSYVPYDHARGAFTEASKLLTDVTVAPDGSRIAPASAPQVASISR
jgi:hypothetical protein